MTFYYVVKHAGYFLALGVATANTHWGCSKTVHPRTVTDPTANEIGKALQQQRPLAIVSLYAGDFTSFAPTVSANNPSLQTHFRIRNEAENIAVRKTGLQRRSRLL